MGGAVSYERGTPVPPSGLGRPRQVTIESRSLRLHPFIELPGTNDTFMRMVTALVAGFWRASRGRISEAILSKFPKEAW